MGFRQRVVVPTVFALWTAASIVRRKVLNLTRFLPMPLRWFRPGWCSMCGAFGMVFWETGEHEECWLNSK